jgi:hypothetical protein
MAGVVRQLASVRTAIRFFLISNPTQWFCRLLIRAPLAGAFCPGRNTDIYRVLLLSGEAFIAYLDYQLLFEARRLITGANVHRVKEMIFAYEESVDLHNRQWPSHREYQPQAELRLRRYVDWRRMEQRRLTAHVNRSQEEAISEERFFGVHTD